MNYKIIRTRRRTLAVTVSAKDGITVRAPLRYPKYLIEQFMRENESRIMRKLREVREREQSRPHLGAEDIRDGARVPYLGGELTIKTDRDAKTAYRDGDLLICPDGDAAGAATKFLKKEIRAITERMLAEYAAKAGLAYMGPRISGARRRWGSCSAKNSISLSWRLIFCPRECIEYVVMHELAHIRHKNHSREFWAYVERYMPDWKERRKKLAEHAHCADYM